MFLLLCLSDAYPSDQLSDVAKGLDYLHSSNVIYGDLKGVRGCPNSSFTTILMHVQPNILIDAAGHARITDFDSTTVATDMDSEPTTPSQRGFTPQWTAPEVLEEGPHSKEADIFAFAMVMIEVRHRRPTVCKIRPTVISDQHRCLLAQFHSVIVLLPWLCWLYSKASARNGPHIHPSQKICGY